MTDVPRKYRGLRWIGVIASLAAWVVLLLIVVALLTLTSNVGVEWARWVLGGMLVLWGIFTFLQLFVTGNVLLLLNDVEHQSRTSLDMLSRLETMMQTPRTTTGTRATLPASEVTTPVVEPPPAENQPSESKPQTV